MLPIASSAQPPSTLGAVSPAALRALLGGIALVLLVAVLIAWVKSLGGNGPERARQVARISVLPDTPPPPPPPPPPRKDEPPKPEARPLQQPTPQAQAPTPKADAPIRMEGAAGDGPSAFSAGAVSQEYQGGAPTIGGGASAPAIADRAAERLYANTVRQLLRDEIERRLAADAGELTSSFALWIDRDGRIARFALDAGTASGNDAAMQSALDAASHSLQLPPPPSAEPLRFRLTVRGAG